jgi:NAD(P)-dependent dehydrogenase (short-subunit alcohol dehydrogenase family)
MGQVAIVTGGGSGIGLAAGTALAEAGWDVILAGRRLAVLQAACGANSRLVPFACDVTDEGSVQQLFAEAARLFGRLDLLFNNAGAVSLANPVTEISLETWRSVLDVNVTGAFLCAQAAFRQMAAQTPKGGRIINNGSLSAHVPRPNSAPYTVSKHAMTGLTRILSLEGRAHDIACGQIDIGNAATGATAGLGAGALQPDGRRIPEPLMDLSSVARSILHMASLPLEANVQFMTVMATSMPYIGRG